MIKFTGTVLVPNGIQLLISADLQHCIPGLDHPDEITQHWTSTSKGNLSLVIWLGIWLYKSGDMSLWASFKSCTYWCNYVAHCAHVIDSFSCYFVVTLLQKCSQFKVFNHFLSHSCTGVKGKANVRISSLIVTSSFVHYLRWYSFEQINSECMHKHNSI